MIFDTVPQWLINLRRIGVKAWLDHLAVLGILVGETTKKGNLA